MQDTLFTIDNTDIIVKEVTKQIQEFKRLNWYCSKLTKLYFISKAVGEYTELMFHDRIKYVEKIYEEWFDDISN